MKPQLPRDSGVHPIVMMVTLTILVLFAAATLWGLATLIEKFLQWAS